MVERLLLGSPVLDLDVGSAVASYAKGKKIHVYHTGFLVTCCVLCSFALYLGGPSRIKPQLKHAKNSKTCFTHLSVVLAVVTVREGTLCGHTPSLHRVLS